MKAPFSLMLAWRYLNPRRAWTSSITLISVTGVMLGVLVLVVVMAVYAGLEREQKKRLLGFSPHVLAQSINGQMSAASDWRAAVAALKSQSGVAHAYASIEDYAIVDSAGLQRPVSYQAVDGSDAEQLSGLAPMLDLEQFPGSTTDLGLDARVVVSSQLATQFSWKLGDRVQLISPRNLEHIARLYRSTEKPVLRERFAAVFTAVDSLVRERWREDASGFTMNRRDIQILNALYPLQDHNDIRPAERDQLIALLQIIDASTHDEAADTFHFAAGQRAAFATSLNAVLQADAAQLDATVHQQLRGAILPKEATIVGVFQSSMMVKMPDLFIPLPMAQQLAGLGDAVQGVAIRIEDPYLVDQSLGFLQQALGPNWILSTWMEQYAPFFALINQQRVMMYFVLSFIVLISAFSMMAVMFTVTIQKRREIGVMKALGATSWQIMQVFLYQGCLLGLAGSALGVGLGRLVVHYRDVLQSLLRHLHFDPFSARLTGFQTLPAHMNLAEQIGIATMGLLFCMLASLLPACVAARSDAAKSLRNG